MNVTTAILDTVLSWGVSPRRINGGGCFDFAHEVYAKLRACGDKTCEIWGVIGYHFYLKSKGKFYDAEAPDGVKKLGDLPIFNNPWRHQPGRPVCLRGTRIKP